MSFDKLPTLPEHITRLLNEQKFLNSREANGGGSYTFIHASSQLNLPPRGKIADAHEPRFVQSDFRVPYFHDEVRLPSAEPLTPEVALVLSAHDEIRRLGSRATEAALPPARGLLGWFRPRGLENLPELPKETQAYTLGELTGNSSEVRAGAVTLAIPALLLPGETRGAALFATSVLPANELENIFAALAENPAATLRYLAELTGDRGVNSFHPNYVGSTPKSHEAYFTRLIQNSNFGRTAVMRCVTPLGEMWDAPIN